MTELGVTIAATLVLTMNPDTNAGSRKMFSNQRSE
jgi:hypothetical protein